MVRAIITTVQSTKAKMVAGLFAKILTSQCPSVFSRQRPYRKELLRMCALYEGARNADEFAQQWEIACVMM